MRSISPRWVSENDWARAGSAASASTAAATAITSGRSRRCIENFLSVAAGSRRRLVGYDIVGPDPTGRSRGKPNFGSPRELARGLELAARKRRLGRREIRFGEISLLAIGHRQLTVAVGHIGLAGHRHPQQRNRLGGVLRLVGGDQRLGEQDLDQGGIGLQSRGAAQWRKRFGGPA